MWTKALKTCSLSGLLVLCLVGLPNAQQTNATPQALSSVVADTEFPQMAHEIPLATTLINRFFIRTPKKHRPIPGTQNPSSTERIQFDVHETVVYGVFGREQTASIETATRAHMSPTLFGFGVERPIDRGLALRFEILQDSSGDMKASNPLSNATAALRLRLRF